MSRRKCMAPRHPCGRSRPSRDTELLSPTETRRLRDAAVAGLRDQLWATTIGRLHLTGRLTTAQLAAGKRWAELAVAYSIACQSPCPPKTRPLDASGGRPSDPDSDAGVKESRRHERATAAYLDGRHALRLAGREAERVVDSVCVQDHAPAGLCELDALRAGLQSLSTWWSARRKTGTR
jgi:hypothetical protein